MPGFFQIFEPSRRQALHLLPECNPCGLKKGCHSPVMELYGKGKKGIMVVGEAPGKDEDEKGRPFVGATGRLLYDALEDLGINLYEDCWIINAARCRPPNNKLPEKSVDYCRPLTVKDLKEKQPKLTLLFGSHAIRSVIGWVWREDKIGGINKWAGWTIPCKKTGGWVCPLYHPASLFYDKQAEVARIIWERHLKKAISLLNKPPAFPDYESKVRVEVDHSKAAKVIRSLIGRRPVAIDYETNMKKPDSSKSEIVSCAVSDGETTISYPWYKDTITATRELILSDTPKIASNMKFEERWTRREFGHGVRNWVLDTMLAAHVLDNRSGITSIKFQAFALLGQEDWEYGVKAYLKSTKAGGNEPNRIKEIPIRTLLKYGGMDALLEWEVARIQSKKLGLSLF